MFTARIPSRTAIEGLIEETVNLFHRFKVAAEQVDGGGDMAAGKRGILKCLQGHGPQTVPQMARARPVSRQHIQSLVDPLAKEGYVEFVANPHHKRSSLVRLTGKGKILIAEIARREESVYRLLEQEFPDDTLLRTAATLQNVRQFLESADWQQIFARRRPNHKRKRRG